MRPNDQSVSTPRCLTFYICICAIKYEAPPLEQRMDAITPSVVYTAKIETPRFRRDISSATRSCPDQASDDRNCCRNRRRRPTGVWISLYSHNGKSKIRVKSVP
ncbi:Ypt/Rab-GAP domain of gyp1p superfamily protein [Striga asiatica]|uniref:Ypt/Rab-GAP domain of gyp1p superfamily protein n=1 Tax=Striga asiatica TaxID=4170 RepID=A0A5A7QHU5_STRAF|nr:Ypt/Rab-GAP domain of gyp1p superfamily protein [Striga asiatica]